MSKQIATPGEYSCEWILDGEVRPGVVELRSSRRPRGEIFDLGELSSRKFWSAEVTRLPKLTGKLRDNSDIVLLDVVINRWFPDRADVSSATAIVGFELNVEDIVFDEVEFQVGGLAELAGVTPVAKTEFPRFVKGQDRRFGMTWNEESEREWELRGDRINLGFHFNAKVNDPYQFVIQTRPVVTLSGSPRPLSEWWSAYIEPIRAISSLSTAKPQSVRWIVLSRRVREPKLGNPNETIDRAIRSQVFASDLNQESYFAERGDPTRPAFVTLSEEGSSLARYVDRWSAGAQGQSVFQELLVACMSDGLTSRARFLTIISALESWHAASFDDEARIERHKITRDHTLRRIRDRISVRDFKWIGKYLDARGAPTLEQRLRRIYEDLDADLREAIRPHVDPIPLGLHSIRPGATNVWQCIAALRNDLAHGGRSHAQNEVLAGLRLSRTILIAVTLTDIGAPASQLSSYIRAELWRVS